MRSRNIIRDSVTTSRLIKHDSSNSDLTKLLTLEMLLDIRDQNEEIINQLKLIKTWSSKY